MSAATAAVVTADTEIISDVQASRLLPSLRQRLDALHARVRTMHQAPIKAFDHRHGEFVRSLAGKTPREQHAVLTVGVAYFEAMAADSARWPGTKFSEDQAQAVATAQIAEQQLRSMGLTFNPHAFVASLRSRGIAASLGPGGRISIAPASMLNPTDREQLRSHRAEIVGALTDREFF